MKKTAFLLSIISLLWFCGCNSYTVSNSIVSSENETSENETVLSAEISTSLAETNDISENAHDRIEFTTTSGDDRMGLSSVVNTIQSSVVAINVTGTASYYHYTYPTEGSGSGVIVSEDGYIVTNNHVISGGNSVTVFLNDTTSYPAAVIGSDSVTDIAVLKINATGLTAAKFGDSSTLRVGDFALAIGNPLGEYQGSVTFGIISALNRDVEIQNETHRMFQVDAAINPGNSGGGMFDSNGMLIGIVTAKNISEEVEGLGFVLPMNDVKPVIEDLINHGYVKGRPTLGFEPVEITSMRVANYYGLKRLGVYVNSITQGSCAEQCGLQFKDYISTADGETVATVERLNEILNSKKVGDTLVLEVWRGEEVLDVVLVIGERVE